MKFSLLQENLTNAVSTVSRTISSTPQLPVLGNILIKAEKQEVIFVGTNLENTIFFKVSAKIEKTGEVSVSAKTFVEFVGSLDADKVELEERGGKLLVTYRHGEAKFSTLPTKDFPSKKPPVFDKKKPGGFNLSASQLTESLKKVVFAAAADETRPVLAGVFFTQERGGLRLVATDGYRLSLVDTGQRAGGEKVSMIVSAGALRELEKGIKKEGEVAVFFDEEGKQVYFSQKGMVLGTRLIEGDFPDYRKILPDKAVSRVETDREELLQGVRTAATFARESANIVRVKINQKQLSLLASAAQTGEGEFKLPEAKISGEKVEVAFNYRFLLEALSVFEGERIVIEITGGLAPVKLTSPDDKGFCHIIMPVRLQG